MFEKPCLSDYFNSVVSKRLSKVEVSKASNQHEFNGVGVLREIFGDVVDGERLKLDAEVFYFGKEESCQIKIEGQLTWYNSRWRQPHRSPEYRLYYDSRNIGPMVVEYAREGDLLLVATGQSNPLVLIICSQGSVAEHDIISAFNITDHVEEEFVESRIDATLSHPSLLFLEECLEIKIASQLGEHYLDQLITRFGLEFPKTSVFSKCARDLFPDELDVEANPDSALTSFFDFEFQLFKLMEEHLIWDRINNTPFENVGEFLHYSLSVNNRRKSRAGHSLQNHLQFIFCNSNIEFDKEQKTESNKKPDFMFPKIESYHNPNFPTDGLTMLAVKTTCKDRWRQILDEAIKIENKHLLTLEEGISVNQTSQMSEANVQLVVPTELHSSYLAKNQQANLIDLKAFIELVKIRQERYLRN